MVDHREQGAGAAVNLAQLRGIVAATQIKAVRPLYAAQFSGIGLKQPLSVRGCRYKTIAIKPLPVFNTKMSFA